MTKSTVEVIYALPQRALVVTLTLGEGATVLDAVRASGIAADYAALAIFGERVAPGQRLRDGDRVELLRALAVPPMEARRRRAARSAKR
ncbi:MAG: RnfH family protein [Betaproteobacteria bacterium]|nr:MAG: RnfH family protein [Betaproteobacteria bacterium]